MIIFQRDRCFRCNKPINFQWSYHCLCGLFTVGDGDSKLHLSLNLNNYKIFWWFNYNHNYSHCDLHDISKDIIETFEFFPFDITYDGLKLFLTFQ